MTLPRRVGSKSVWRVLKTVGIIATTTLLFPLLQGAIMTVGEAILRCTVRNLLWENSDNKFDPLHGFVGEKTPERPRPKQYRVNLPAQYFPPTTDVARQRYYTE
eukprot:GEZU01019893.1.p1 GENE.GEZU01019893.1~~GEZU01019893.1.p1  ORF type:complete len:104 (+),score=4.15 GEZU01019893.1:68-379(+)